MLPEALVSCFTTGHSGSLLLQLQVQPAARKNQIVGVIGSRLKVKVAAPAVGGAANAELIKYLAGAFGLKRRDVAISLGEGSRQKTLTLSGIDLNTALAKVGCLLANT